MLAVALSGLLTPTPASAAPRTWYVQAGASHGIGTQDRPWGSLAQVERRSSPGDTIVVLRSRRALDGGIALKARQRLRGAGGDVRGSGARAPVLTNTTTRLDGDAVRLADHATVSNLRISDPHRGAVYGRDVTGVRVTGNDISGHNSSCADGFLIPRFNAPTSLPGVGIPIAHGLQNGWAGIMIDASHRRFSARVDHNLVRDAECGDGIDIRAWGTARGTVTVTDNEVHSLQQGRDFTSLLAIGVQARDRAQVRAGIHRNSQALLGRPHDIDLLLHGADSEGVFLNADGPATLDATVKHNDYTNEHGWGGFSANGLEMVAMGSGARMRAVVRDSHFSGAPGDLIEHGALGTDAVMDMRLERVTAERSTGFGNTVVLPFNNGDCVLAGSLGARNIVRLRVHDSVLRGCANNGLSLGSNVTNGTGSTTEISARITDSVVSGNRGGNVGIRNFTRLDRLSFAMERTDLRRSSSLGSGIADFSAQDLGTTRSARIDLGGGDLDSTGGNCLAGGLLAADVVRYDVAARANWWNRPGGAGPLRRLAIGGHLDAGVPLAAAPAWCR